MWVCMCVALCGTGDTTSPKNTMNMWLQDKDSHPVFWDHLYTGRRRYFVCKSEGCKFAKYAPVYGLFIIQSRILWKSSEFCQLTWKHSCMDITWDIIINMSKATGAGSGSEWIMLKNPALFSKTQVSTSEDSSSKLENTIHNSVSPMQLTETA